MTVPFGKSPSGRLLWLAAAFFLASAAATLITGSLYAIGIGMPAAITVSFVAVGLGMEDYTKETMFSILLLPPALWGFYYLYGELEFAHAHSWGYGIALLGVVALFRAAVPGGDSE